MKGIRGRIIKILRDLSCLKIKAKQYFKYKHDYSTLSKNYAEQKEDFRRIHNTEYIAQYTFGSTLCREQHFRMPLYKFWCNAIKEQPRLHRKQWEFVYICQTLHERGMLTEGRSGLGFGVGSEPLPALFASYGVNVTASDLDLSKASELGWVATDQHSNSLSDLNKLGLCDEEKFNRLVSFMNVDMNNIPSNLTGFDFCWSSCAFEHLGSIENGLAFVRNSIKTLKPGGVAVHTTEYNLSSNTDTLDNNPSFVIFRRQDIELLVATLQQEGHFVETIDFYPGNDTFEQYIDMPPYIDEPHLRLQLAGKYNSTSIGLIVHKVNNEG